MSFGSYPLAYCTNVHAGADLNRTIENLRRHARRVKAQFAPRDSLGIGLWLAAPAVRELLTGDRLRRFSDLLGEFGLVPYTFNGFPQGDFHEPVVKHRVYSPTWWEDDRVQYTLDLITALDALLPVGLEGSISTLPIAWQSPPPRADQMSRVVQNFQRVVQFLARLEAETGRLIYVCLEPEPGCVLERSMDVVHFFADVLWPQCDRTQCDRTQCDRTQCNRTEAQRYLRVCHDICHAAVMFEDQQEVLARYAQHEIQVGKLQVSSAVQVDFDRLDDARRHQAAAALASFAEDRYLHQTCVRSAPNSAPQYFEDLPQALNSTSPSGQWRVHFHVPIYVEELGLLRTTQADIRACLQATASHPALKHCEVETYAWSVLPADMRRVELADGIARELEWLAALTKAARLR